MLTATKLHAAENELLVGIGYGQSKYELADHFIYDSGTGTLAGRDIEDTSSNAFAFSLVDKLSKHLFVEVSYIDFGSFSAKNTAIGSGGYYPPGEITQKIEASTFDISIGLMHQPKPRLSLFAKAGYYIADVTYSGYDSETLEDSGASMGFGVAFDFHSTIIGKLEWLRHSELGGKGIGPRFIEGNDISTMLFTLAYRL